MIIDRFLSADFFLPQAWGNSYYIQICPYCSVYFWWHFNYAHQHVYIQMKKCLEEMQTLRTGCVKAKPNFFVPPQTPFPRVQGGQNVISWRWSLPLPTNPVWWGSMHAISSYLGNISPTHPQTNRQDRLQYTVPQLACSVNKESSSHMNGWQRIGQD